MLTSSLRPLPLPIMRKPTVPQRLRAKHRSQAMLIGVTWYTPESWAEVKATASDPHCFEDSFEQWKAVAVKAQREFLRSGVRAVECLVVPAELAEWCARHGQPNDATARAEYVTDKLSAAYAGKM